MAFPLIDGIGNKPDDNSGAAGAVVGYKAPQEGINNIYQNEEDKLRLNPGQEARLQQSAFLV